MRSVPGGLDVAHVGRELRLMAGVYFPSPVYLWAALFLREHGHQVRTHVAYLPVQVLSGDDLTACTIVGSHPCCLYVGAKPMPGWVIKDKPVKWFRDCERKQAKSRKRMHTAKQRSGFDTRGSTIAIPFQTFEICTDLNTMVISMQCEQRRIL
jgi:hypothetical protein